MRNLRLLTCNTGNSPGLDDTVHAISGIDQTALGAFITTFTQLTSSQLYNFPTDNCTTDNFIMTISQPTNSQPMSHSMYVLFCVIKFLIENPRIFLFLQVNIIMALVLPYPLNPGHPSSLALSALNIAQSTIVA